MTTERADEYTSLLRHTKPNGGFHEHHNPDPTASSSSPDEETDHDVELVSFDDGDDPDNPRNWPLKWKYIQVFLVFLIGLICPMSSSLFAPGIGEIAEAFSTSTQLVLAAQTGFVCMLGIGPLFFAPMSETFGRRLIFLTNLSLFTLMQIPSALAPSVEWFVFFRTVSGLFGSVGVANGGGSVSDLFETHERATVLGFYLLGPLLGPTLGPFFGGLILADLHWRWLFWVQLIVTTVVLVASYFLLYETCAVVVLEQKKSKLEKENPDKKYQIKDQSDVGLFQKIAANSTRACKILFKQPIVMVLSAYQALIFSTLYSLYSNYSKIWSSPPYNFDIVSVALSYLAPAIGFILAACIIVPFIDRIYNRLAKTYGDGEGKPEYRLPLANIGAVFLPVSLFWFGWTVEFGKPFLIPLSAMLLFGASQVSIFNTVQNYYIDAFESQAASALAAGAFLRSVIGGIVPLFVSALFDKFGYGIGMSVFGGVAVLLMPAPVLFFKYGAILREKFAIES